ncbi:PrgI family protein [Candidatus Collierbacteria bacterium]|nr:PrgI family protein [Candidatus Collierbacteria bacterium]
MIEHPIPQNVTSYQFRLIGDMTLKQFIELAGGVVAGWLIWSLDLPAIIRWPMVIMAVILGFGLAFMPLEDRPLDQWFIAFFRAIYRPTIFVWKKAVRDDILSFQASPAESKSVLESAVKMPTAKLESLLAGYKINEAVEADPLLDAWEKRLAAVPQLFSEVTVPKKLADVTVFPQVRAVDLSYHVSDLTPVLHPLTPPEDPDAILRGEITLPAHRLRVPQNLPIAIGDAPAKPALLVKRGDSLSQIGTSEIKLPSFNTAVVKSRTGAVSATVMQSLILPSSPSIPNVLTGIVVTSDGQIADNAIVEIRRLTDHLPVRAVKSNKLGHFAIATPLENGSYEILTDKDGLAFGILKIDVGGLIMPPIEIRAKKEKMS